MGAILPHLGKQIERGGVGGGASHWCENVGLNMYEFWVPSRAIAEMGDLVVVLITFRSLSLGAVHDSRKPRSYIWIASKWEWLQKRTRKAQPWVILVTLLEDLAPWRQSELL